MAIALPEERRRIKELLAKFPPQRETKVEKLIGALGELWRQNPQERMVVFATYLGSVEMLGSEIEKQYPGKGVTVLKGGDHGPKTAAETLLTTEREFSMQKETVQLLGLDHPIVTAYLRKFRELPPEELGLCIQSADDIEGVLAAWAVEARGEKGQLKRMIVTLGVDAEGKRHVAWEREPESLWRSQVSSQNGKHADKKLTILRNTLEPMLRRELEHRELDKVSQGFEAKLVAWVELVPSLNPKG